MAGRETGEIRALRATTGEPLDPAYSGLDADQLGRATTVAREAFATYRTTTPGQRAQLLEAIAAEIESVGEAIVARALAESGLSEVRLTGELARTIGQLRMFADVARLGDHLGVRIDEALPDRTPLPRPDIRQRQVPVGVVAVFGASNFPLAFSVAGGDTASALAAGCPVVVKAHNAHPGTCELVGAAIVRALDRCGLPAGVFGLVYGSGTEIGRRLVRDPRISAAGFTGSRAGGLALVGAAASRPVPIPVYAEMSSVNPVLVLPGAVADPGSAGRLAAAYVSSLTLGSGQFCTNPGLLFLPSGPDGDAVLAAAADAVRTSVGQTMLTTPIADAFASGATALRSADGVRLAAEGCAGEGVNAPAPVLVATDVAGVVETAGVVTREVFGAAGVVVRYAGVSDLRRALATLEGQLTVSVHCAESDHPQVAGLLPDLEDLAGRVIVNGWPTGVEVCHAMVHGGPFPATSDPRTTSVGSRAIERFQRPVGYQNLPDALLPAPLRQANPWHLNRRVDGRIRLADDPPDG
jgi:NADP-dependent aldehyde dehydrogenase